MRKNEAVFEEKYNRWKIHVQKNGVRRSFYSSLPGKKGKIEAEAKADKWIASGNTENKRLDDVFCEFLTKKALNVGEAYLKNLESYYRIWIAPTLSNKRVSLINNQDWQDIIDSAYKQNKAKKTLQNIRGTATAIYAFCRKKRYEMERPEFIEIPKNAKKKEKSILQPDQIKTLFSVDGYISRGKYQKSYYIYAFRLIVVLGLRRGELAGIKKTDIKNNVLYLKRSINKLKIITSGKNENAIRKIALPIIAQKIIQDQSNYMSELGIASEWLFPNESGLQTDTNKLYKRWKTYATKNGIDISLHELRHTMISHMKSDVPSELLKQYVGHSQKMDTFGIYGHEVEGESQTTAGIVESVFEKVLK